MNERRWLAIAFVIAMVAAGAVGAAVPALPGMLPDSANAGGRVEPVRDTQPRGGRRIDGSVGPGFTIDVSPRRVRPGTYRIVVRDRSGMHNWHISGPGRVDRKTRVGFTGRKRFTVRLVEGTYRIRCDPHSDTMRTRLVVRRPG